MKRSALALATLLFAGCSDMQQADVKEAPAANAVEAVPAASAPLVTNFKMEKLAGLAVRDHADGVQVVTPPTARGNTPPPPGTNDIVWAFAKGVVFTSVNGMKARDATHFRELMDTVGPNDDVKLEYKMYVVDVGDGWSRIETTPPEDREQAR